jgi:hypothetical protein
VSSPEVSPRCLYFACRIAANLFLASSNWRSIRITSDLALISWAMPPTIRLFSTKYLSSSMLWACWAALTRLSVDLMTAVPAWCNLLVAVVSPSALTLHATNSCAVELATCLADEINLSSLPIPWTSALALSTRLWVAAATSLAAEIKPSDHCPSSDDEVGVLETFPLSISSRCAALAAFTKADVAEVIDFAASRIISSKLSDSSRSCVYNRQKIVTKDTDSSSNSTIGSISDLDHSPSLTQPRRNVKLL